MVIIVRNRCRWCRLLLIAHLDTPRVGVVIGVMIDVTTAEARFQPPLFALSVCGIPRGHVSAFSYMERQANNSGPMAKLCKKRQAKSRERVCL